MSEVEGRTMVVPLLLCVGTMHFGVSFYAMPLADRSTMADSWPQLHWTNAKRFLHDCS